MAQLQEAQFACFEDEELDGTSSSALLGGGGGGGVDFALHLQHQQQQQAGLKTFAIAEPSGAARGLPQKSFARVRSLECSGSGSFYFQNEALKDRFVCWRVIKNIVVLREWSLHETLAGNGIRLQFPAPVVSTGVFAVESWEGNTVSICVVTHAGTIHRFTYAIPATTTHSIFTTADASFPPKPATSSKCDVVASLSPDEIITVALWVNEYNLVLGADSGRVIGVNFGLPATPLGPVEMQEFAFSDESVVKWLWNGLVKSSAVAKWQGDDRRQQENAIVAVTCFPIESDMEDEAEDVCIVTVSADLTLRAWSYASQSCLGKQDIRSLVNADFDDEALAEAFAVNAKIVALPATSTDNCRLLVHIDTTASFSQDIYLLRGDVTPLPTGGRRDLALVAARVFTVDSPASAQSSKRLKIVDFAVDKNYLYSSWRSASGDFVYSHANPMALTGPRIIRGEVVSSLNAQMQKYDLEDDEWPFALKDEGIVELIDNFFAERMLLPGRFSRQNLYKAVLEYHGDLEIPLRPLFSSAAGHQESKYKDLLVKIVSDKLLSAIGNSSMDGSARHGARDPNVLRIGIWKSIIELCNKHWRVENVPIGFATTTNSLLPGSPVLLRRNRVALLFPSATTITAPFLSKLTSSSADCVRELVADILPVFDGFPSHSFQSFIHREVTDVVSDWKVESFVALARHCVRMGLKSGTGSASASIANPDLVLTRALLRLSKILGGETEFHDQVLRDLVEHLFPFDVSHDGSSSNSPSPKKRHESYDDDDDDEDQAMDGGESSSSFASASRDLFGGNEICFAFEQVAARTIDEMATQALRVVLFLSYLVDAQPAFVSSATLRNVSRFYLPRSITIYQRWRLSKWIASQNIAHATEIDSSSAKASATLLPPLLQLFLLEANSKLNASGPLKRARSVLQIALMNNVNSVQSEEAHSVLGSFTREILRLVSQPTEPLVLFLQKRKQFALLRSMFCCNLSDVSLHGGVKYETPDQSPEVQRYVRSIGECLAREGGVAAKDSSSKEHALWCFQQAIRCFSICLSSFLSDHDEPHASSMNETAERFIYDTIGLLKETIPRGFFRHMLGFLWTVVTQALNRSSSSSGDGDSALQTFVWVNVFKYSVEERLFRDAHLALMHTLDVSSSVLAAQMSHDSENGDDEPSSARESTSAECVNYLVKELCRYGHLDLICEFQWGALEAQVEKHIQWQAANANVVSKGDASVDPAVLMYHNLLFAFYARKQQPANAAAAMHALYLRLRLASQLKSASALQAQRNALYAATNALLALPEPNRWIVRKYHTEELLGSSSAARKAAVATAAKESSQLPLNIVTAQDFAREIAVLDGKLQLLHLGQDESVLLSAMDGAEVVALLVDAALACCEWTSATSTALEKAQESARAIELAVDIVQKTPALSYSNITKSMARYCVAVVSSAGLESLCWRTLQQFLEAIDSLEQYQVAAATILEWKVKIELPAWLYDRLAHPARGNAAKLLQLYLKYGLLADAVALADQMIPDELLNESEASFRQRVTTPSASLPWIPYNLFDAVLDAADAVLQNRGAGAFGATASGSRSEAVLRSSSQRFKDKLSSYFKYIALLEEARAAAGVARNASGTGAGGGASGFSFGVPVRSAGALF